MYYITTRQKLKKKNLKWAELIESDSSLETFGSAATITRKVETIDKEWLDKIDLSWMIGRLKWFNETYKNLFAQERKSLYRHFSIPKKTGGLRPIDEPCGELMTALNALKDILTKDFGLLYHTSAYAYVKNRNTLQEVRKHQKNESNWFYKTDVSGFFPNTTLEFTMRMLAMLFPTCEICKDEDGRRELEKALSLAFLNGGLPQGTPVSPTIVNLCAIPIDFKLFNELAHRRFVYTRYADDIHISCRQTFSMNKMTDYIESVFKEFDAPWTLKPEKTRYGSRKGKNVMLGLHLNADNNITTGFRTKKYFKAMTNNFVLDNLKGEPWDKETVMAYAGLLSYYKMVEKEYYDNLIKKINEKYKCDVEGMIKVIVSRPSKVRQPRQTKQQAVTYDYEGIPF